MDNDYEIVKKIKRFGKQVKFKWTYRDVDILPEEDGNKKICGLIESGKPFMVARGGATEMRCIGEYLSGKQFTKKIADEIFNLSGVFPPSQENLKKFCQYYIECMQKADLLSLWGVGAEAKVVHQFCTQSEFTELHALEPYYFAEPWSQALKGKRVLIVHPFKSSIESQYLKREKLFPNERVLPEFAKITCVKSVQSIAGEATEYESWFDALHYMQGEIQKADFDVAIIGAGAYGLPLAAYCKSIGKQAIQMSGATQILFGIKGKRWDEHPVISAFYNDYWIRPNDNETPKHKDKVEGGSYW